MLDLSDCVLCDIAVLAEVDPAAWDLASDQVCVVCGRLTGRQLLARIGLADRFAVFGRPEDALQARVLCESGYGHGWDMRIRAEG